MTEDDLPVSNKIISGKYRRMVTLSDERGVIAALAIDQRGSLKKALAALTRRDVTAPEIVEFKQR